MNHCDVLVACAPES